MSCASRRLSGGRTPTNFSSTNKGCCFSLSTRLLFFALTSGALIVTGLRCFFILVAASTFSDRSTLASLAIFFSICLRRISLKVVDNQAAKAMLVTPRESIRTIHEISAKTVNPKKNRESKITVAPVKLNTSSTDSLMVLPSTPPNPDGYMVSMSNWILASDVALTITNTNPIRRKLKVTESNGSASFSKQVRKICNALAASNNGKRNAMAPNRLKNISANRAPAGPMAFCT